MHAQGDGEASLQNAAARAGVDPARLVFARWAPTSEEHVRRSGLAAISLDTPLYNSMTTACDVLWAGARPARPRRPRRRGSLAAAGRAAGGSL